MSVLNPAPKVADFVGLFEILPSSPGDQSVKARNCPSTANRDQVLDIHFRFRPGVMLAGRFLLVT